MESPTKNRQGAEVIKKMVEYFFAPTSLKGFRELTEGLFNMAYLVELSDGREVIDFIKGYGIAHLTASQAKRVLWYDIYLLILMALEYKYRAYESDEQYQWATKMPRQQFNKVLSL